jgi:hypothetical protein
MNVTSMPSDERWARLTEIADRGSQGEFTLTTTPYCGFGNEKFKNQIAQIVGRCQYDDQGKEYVSLQYSILYMRTMPNGNVEANAQKEAIARREKLAAKVLEIVTAKSSE